MNVQRTKYDRPVPALSDLSVTEFLTLSRVGFLPHGLVVGCSVYDAGAGGYYQQTREITQLSNAMRAARQLAVKRMRDQARAHDAEGVVGVRLMVEHHTWRGGHTVAKFVALGTAVAFDHEHGPEEFQHAPPLRLQNGDPFTSDLSGQDFVMLLRAGYRPIELAMGSCVYEIDPGYLAAYTGATWLNEEIPAYTQAFFDARETAMDRLAQDLFREWPPGHADSPVGVVGMTVEETTHAVPLQLPAYRASGNSTAVVEYTAVGTAVAMLAPGDPRRAKQLPAPNIVVPLDR
jgi:uncharacterized protein YbjQ (UPF0145 family)